MNKKSRRKIILVMVVSAAVLTLRIVGGCHAYFGMYGEQDGDGVPTLNAEKQITLTAENITGWIMRGEK